MLSLILATIVVCQSPDFRSISFEKPPTVEIGPPPCDCGCASTDCKCKTKIVELEKELVRIKSVLYNKPAVSINPAISKETLNKISTILENPVTYSMVDRWGYTWQDTDRVALSQYVNGLNTGRLGHPRYNEIVLKHTQIRSSSVPVYSAGAVCTLPGGG